jgi:hypothetical protein
MGLDYAEKRAKSYSKGLDRSRIELATPDLFTQQPDCAPRAYAATVGKEYTLSPGDKLGVRLEGEQVVVLRGLDHVATFTNPPAELKAALLSCHGEGCGTVQDSHAMARTAEITVC